jgi:hypothetical protein
MEAAVEEEVVVVAPTVDAVVVVLQASIGAWTMLEITADTVKMTRTLTTEYPASLFAAGATRCISAVREEGRIF